MSDVDLNKIDVPIDAILCGNINCKNQSHNSALCAMYDAIVDSLNNGSKLFSTKKTKQQR